MVWLELLQYIADKLQKADSGLYIVLGLHDPRVLPLKDKDCIVLYRGQEAQDEQGASFTPCSITCYLECWTRDDSPNLAKGYEKLTALETKADKVLLSIKEESGMISASTQILDLVIKQKAGDMDSARPLIGSLYTLSASVYTQEGD